MPMVARDGLHYGANIEMPRAGRYTLTYRIDPPSAGGLGRHSDAVTGVAPGARGDAGPAEREELLALVGQVSTAGQTAEEADRILQRVRRLFTRAQVFEKAEKLVEKYRARAEAAADEVEPTELRELLYFLVDTVLDRQPPHMT